MIEIVVLGGAFALLLALGVPVAFGIGLATALALLLLVPPGPALATVAQRTVAGLDSFPLLAIPFFVLAGEIMDRGGLARRLVDFAKALLAGLPGALAVVHVAASMLFGSISGSAVAAASAVGGVLGPRMEREGYESETTAAINISSATTGLVIPPSNILIIYSLASGGTSIAALFLAGYVPGLLLGLALATTGALLARRTMVHSPDSAAPVAADDTGRDAVGLSRRFLDAAPSLGLLVAVIGGIVGGVFTATEAAAVAVAYAAILAAVYRELRLADAQSVLLGAVTTTAVVLFLVATSSAMSWALAYERVPQEASRLLLAAVDHPAAILLVINVVLLAVGTVLDMTPAVLVFTPIFLPVALELGMDPVHFGIVLVMNLCIGLCTPPVGTVLFVGCGVAGTGIDRVVRRLLPLWLTMVVVLLVVTYVPQLSLWLPRRLGF
ncbi:MAG: TRAP transporter large permease [Acidobacteriota bacterium]